MYNIFVLASMTCKWIWRQEMLSKLEKRIKTPKKPLTWILVVNSTTQYCSPSTGNNITEIGASYIHGPSEENPLFCLARDYGLLDPEALKPENQAMYIDERPHWSPNWFSCSGQWRFYHSLFFPHFKLSYWLLCGSAERDEYFIFCGWCAGQRLSTELMRPALDMFNELMDEIEQFHNRRETPWPSVGHFIRSEVCHLSISKNDFSAVRSEKFLDGKMNPVSALCGGVVPRAGSTASSREVEGQG